MIRRIQNLNEQTVLIVLVVVAVASLALSAVSHVLNGEVAWWAWADSAFQNFSTEMMGAVLTFFLFNLILGAKKEAKEKAEAEQAEKQRLIIELRSEDFATAETAQRLIKAKGWDRDGTLANAFLVRAKMLGFWYKPNLQEANLRFANLEGASFPEANLQGVDFTEANLCGASLDEANLQGAILSNASLEDAYLREAKFDEKTVLPDAKPLKGKSGIFLFAKNHKYVFDKFWTPETDMRRYTDPDHPDFWQPEWVKEQGEAD